MNSDPTSGAFESYQIDPTDIERYDSPNTIDSADDLEYKPDFFVDIVYSFGDIAKIIQKYGETRYTVAECRSKLLRINPELEAFFDKNRSTREAILDISFETFDTIFNVTKLSIIPEENGPEIMYEFDIPDTFITVNGERLEIPVQVFGNSIISDALQMIIPANRQVSSQDIARSLYDLGLFTSKNMSWTDANITYEMAELSTPKFSSKELKISTSYPNDEGLIVQHVVSISDVISNDESESGTSLEIQETIGVPTMTENGLSIKGTTTIRNTASENDKMIIRDAVELLLEKASPIELI
jgi:hypothetical protein